MKSKLQSFLARHPYLEKVISTPDMRTEASLYIASGISFSFTIFCIISGLYDNARWFMTLGIYNFVLALIRIYPALAIQRQIRNPLDAHAQALKEARMSYIIGVALLSVNLAFIGITAETIIRNHTLHYHPILLSILVVFSVVRFILMSIGSFRKRKESATLNHALRIINLTVAFCSLYTTQTAVLETYLHDEILRLILNLIASSLIFFGLLRIAVNLILNARDTLASLRSQQNPAVPQETSSDGE